MLAVRGSLVCQEDSRAIEVSSFSDSLCDLGQVT